ncbi:MAG TPA: carbamoyl-phosphate synthase large subunit [Candidatus Monoglobus merdigallinarum]|uniref:Carbamoyl phosphate synthase large chain n=1 Tax=Candidatus Monoglobus merdigallinarum TaxID=2838698 RepID=A0A9D1TMF4_9FIRM|nr:carbamoyl-phosphate synthase large subunit [Candidatus Monoglobus merdigallinarum]
MPRDNSIKKVLVIGSGPIVIGQAAEFDYSGTQACSALKEDGAEVVLVNSNPATIMTDKDTADYTYIEPLTAEYLEKVIEKERPDSLIAGMGGQTGLNLACELYDSGVLEKYGVKVIGTSIESIKEGEDRDSFKQLMSRTNQPMIRGEIFNTVEECCLFADEIGYPVIVRPAYTLGGTGGGIAETKEQLIEIATQGIHLSRVGQVLIEKCIRGWKEIEFEVIRDGAGNCITVCSMENVDPVGVHTGDSIVVAPAQTLADKEYQMLRTAAIDIINSIEIKGGCNVQFALNPDSFEYAVIEINPRVSRSSALASKATGYPIAKIAAKIALGYNLDEIKNAVTGKTYACFEPAIDYCVVKIPKWPFDKFFGAKRQLGTKMMATGEVMAIGSSFEAALLKGIRSLEIKQFTLSREFSKNHSLDSLKHRVVVPDDERLFDLAELIRRDYLMDKICEITGMDPWFIKKIKKIVEMEERLKDYTLDTLSSDVLRKYKVTGFADEGIADIIGCSGDDIRELRYKYGIHPVYKMVDTCAGEFEAVSPYYYSTYDEISEAVPSDKKKVIVLGSGPIRIGQGIEFDYCSVHSVKALKKMGIETIIINNNPETVSTDFDTADKLYFEPLTEEDVLSVIELEKPDGVILQFGGQTAIKLANFLDRMNVPIFGTKPKYIDEAEDREKFDSVLEKLGIKRPKGRGVWSVKRGVEEAEELGYPLLVRPSYVLGGQGMEITHNREELVQYLKDAFNKDKDNPVLIDRYLGGKELEVDAICDGTDVFIPGIMEHLERAGIHSGDSISIYPPQSISEDIKEKIIDVTRRIAVEMKVIGMINIQFIEFKDELYIIEVNPRSSRTVPYITKVTGVPVIELATRVMLGETLSSMGYGSGISPESGMVAVKVPVFSTEKLPMVEVSLGPEMRSTGEVLGVGRSFEEAIYKGFVGADITIPHRGSTILATVRERDKENFLPIAKKFAEMGCSFIATQGTAEFLNKNGISVKRAKKISEGVPNVLDVIRSGVCDLIIDIPKKGNDKGSDGFKIRRCASECSITLMTSLDTVRALVSVMEKNMTADDVEVISVKEIK